MASFADSIAPYLAQVQGLPYVWGGKSPAAGGFDCSGFVSWLYKQAFGITLTSYVQAMYGETDPIASPVQGDLAFWDVNAAPDVQHVGIYWGPGQVLDARGGSGVGFHSTYGSPEYRRVKGFTPSGASAGSGNKGALVLVAILGLILFVLD